MMKDTPIHSERRSAERFVLAWPAETDRGPALTRDLSLSGVYLLTDARLAVDDQVRMVVTLSEGGRLLPFRLALKGKVVRVEEIGGARGAGIALDEESTGLLRAS